MKHDLYKICSILIIVMAVASFFYACKYTLEDSRAKQQHQTKLLDRDAQNNIVDVKKY